MENQKTVIPGGADKNTPETLAGTVTAPDIGGAVIPGEQAQAEKPGPKEGAVIPPANAPAPEVTGGASAVEAEKKAGPDKTKDPAPPAPDGGSKEKPGRGDKSSKAPKDTKGKVISINGVASGESAGKEAAAPAPVVPEQPPEPREAPRSDSTEQIVYLKLSELHPFNTYRNHPFGVRDDADMQETVKSVRDYGVQNPALVRPRQDGGYEIISGHRRHKASELAGYTDMPCIVREMSDFDAVQLMKDSNKQRGVTLPSERARLLELEFEAVKHQGVRDASGQNVPKADVGKRSIEIVGENNNMNGKQVQRYIRLTKLVPDLLDMVDNKKLGFTSAVEISFIKQKNQNLIAVSIEGEQSSPSLQQAQRMRKLDEQNQLTGDVIDGILGEQKKEDIKVIITGSELDKYFGKDKTPQQMKAQIMKLLDEWAAKEKTINPPEKNNDRDK